MFKAVADWLNDKWRDEPSNAQDLFDFHLQSTFGTESGKYILNKWITDIYCDMSYYEGQDAMATAFNEGSRSFIHEILKNLDRIQNKKQLIVEPENAEFAEGQT